MKELWSKIIGNENVISFGVKKYGDKVKAWVNFRPPYENNGGNWMDLGEDKYQAVDNLYKQIIKFRNLKTPNK